MTRMSQFPHRRHGVKTARTKAAAGRKGCSRLLTSKQSSTLRNNETPSLESINDAILPTRPLVPTMVKSCALSLSERGGPPVQ
jgi:hypothetical protein